VGTAGQKKSCSRSASDRRPVACIAGPDPRYRKLGCIPATTGRISLRQPERVYRAVIPCA